jgi:hypothetical protein
MPISQTLARVSRQVTRAEVNRLLLVKTYTDALRNIHALPGRHERLAAKHTNAADCAREGEPTPPGVIRAESFGPGTGRVGVRLKLAALRKAERIAHRKPGPVPIAKESLPHDEKQRARLLRGSRLLTK